MKFTAFVTSLVLVGSDAFAPGAGNARSSIGELMNGAHYDDIPSFMTHQFWSLLDWMECVS